MGAGTVSLNARAALSRTALAHHQGATRVNSFDKVPISDDACLNHAIANMAAFVDELDMKDPPVAVSMSSSKHDGAGRYSFVLHRGIRSTDVDMPSLPLDEVRCTEGSVPRGCPRLYVDGNSWWWPYALDFARTDLEDHDGTVEQREVENERAAKAELARRPRCETCGSVRSLVFATAYVVRCHACDPRVSTYRETAGGTVYSDDGWKHAMHYLVKRWYVPPEVPGHDNPMHPDALCGCTVYLRGGTGTCRRKARHDGRCEPYWAEDRTLVMSDGSLA